MLGLAAAILGVAGLVPKFSAILTTIPQCVLGGATVSVFASPMRHTCGYNTARPNYTPLSRSCETGKEHYGEQLYRGHYPVNIEGTNYVDGGLMMNLPVSTLRRVCNKVVAVNVSPIMAQDYKMNIVSIAMRSFHFMFRANTFPEREKCDLLIEPYNLYGYSNTELEKAEEIFEHGYNTANEVLNQLLAEKGKIWK